MNPKEKYNYYLSEARNYAVSYGISDFRSEQFDAFRHAFASAMMTREFGADIADAAGYAVEIAGYGNGIVYNMLSDNNDEKYSIQSAGMDLYNNSIGRGIIGEYGDLSNADIASVVYTKLNNGELITNFKTDTRVNEYNLLDYIQNTLGEAGKPLNLENLLHLNDLNLTDEQLAVAILLASGEDINIENSTLTASLNASGLIFDWVAQDTLGDLINQNTNFFDASGDFVGNILAFDPDGSITNSLGGVEGVSALLEQFQDIFTNDALLASGIYTSPYAYDDSPFGDYLFYSQDDTYNSIWENLINNSNGIDAFGGNYNDWLMESSVFSDSYNFFMLDNYAYLNSYTFDTNWTFDSYLSNYTYDFDTGFTYSYDFDYSYSDFGSYDYYGYDSFGSFFFPVVLDLDGDGVELTSVLDSIAWFDTEGDGTMYQTGWVGADDGLLAYDENGDGKITTANEIAFANRTEANDTDLEALKSEFDSNNDGKLDANDIDFDKFYIWQDKDSDGESDDGELLTLTQANIQSVNLVGASTNSYAIDGNKISAFTSYIRTDGTIGMGADVALGYDSSGYTATTQTGYTTIKQMGSNNEYIMITDDTGVTLNLRNMKNIDGVFGGDGNDNTSFLYPNDIMSNLILDGGGGNDKLYGSGGDDWLSGGEGNDLMYGSDGNDTIVADSSDTLSNISGGDGFDTLIYDSDNNLTINMDSRTIEAIYSGDGDDKIDGLYDRGFFSVSRKNINGGAGNDTISGSNASDIITGGLDNDTLNGSGGNDIYIYNRGDGNDIIKEYTETRFTYFSTFFEKVVTVNEEDNGGFDTIWFGGTITLDNLTLSRDGANLIIEIRSASDLIDGTITIKDQYSEQHIVRRDAPTPSIYIRHDVYARSIENIQFTDGTTVSLSGLKLGTNADDILYGEKEFDRIYGFSGNDTINGGLGDDTIDGGTGNDTLIGGGGVDTLSYATSIKAISVDLSNENAQDTIGAGVDTITEFENLIGSNYDDILTGNSLNNILEGGLGNDTLDGGIGVDTVSCEGSTAGVVVDISKTLAQDTVGAGTDTITNFENLTGSNYDDILSGNSENNILNGGYGQDTLSYKTATAGVTVNLITTTAQNTIGAGTDTITNFENLIGSDYNDKLTGNSLNNILEGGFGNDILNGSTGIDTVTYESSTVEVTVNLALTAAQTIQGTEKDTITGVEDLIGSNYNDILTGNSSANTINGNGGNDIIDGGAGNDILNGGDGSDTLSYETATAAIKISLSSTIAQATGGSGSDTISNFENLTGSKYNDTLTGSDNDNTILGGLGNDIIEGGLGNDTLIGGDGIDTLSYALSSSSVTVDLSNEDAQDIIGAGTDTITGFENITGSNYDDTFKGNTLNNIILAGLGNDILNGGLGNDTLNGGTGIDTVTYESSTVGVTVNLALTTAQTIQGTEKDTITGVENLTGSNYNDILKGSTLSNTINGLDGDDKIIAGTGKTNDIFDGGNGVDTISYEQATVAVTVNLSNTAAQNTIGNGSDTLTNFENLTGSNYNDTLMGNDSNNTILGGAGIDTMSGGNGNDTYMVDNAGDIVYENLNEGTDTVNSSITYTLGANIENLTLVGTSAINATGNMLNNIIIGNSGANIIDGGVGSDTMSGGIGNDTYAVDDIDDIITELANEGTDTIKSSITYILGANLENLTLIGNDATDATGNELNNIIIGNDANNVLNGGLGNDTLNGGTGIDTVTYQNSTVGVTVNLALTTAQTIQGTEKDTITGIENIIGSNYNDILKGSTLSNAINGLDGDDTIGGNTGNDILNGGAGKDTFVFNTTLNATTNKDTIVDFSSIDDTISLENAIFTKLTTIGTLNSDNFIANATGIAQDINDYILYNTTTGELSYDNDGNGNNPALVFAVLGTTTHPIISYTDFVVI